MASAGRKVMVSFGVPPNVRKKIVVLEDHSTRVKSDLDSLREKMLAILLEDGSIFDVGGSKLTKVRDLLVYVYDSDFEIDVEMSSEHILNHGEKSLSLKIRNPQLIPHAETHSGTQLLNTDSTSEFSTTDKSNFSQNPVTDCSSKEYQALNSILGDVQNGFSDRSEVSTQDRNPDPVTITEELESVTAVIVNDDESELPSNNRVIQEQGCTVTLLSSEEFEKEILEASSGSEIIQEDKEQIESFALNLTLPELSDSLALAKTEGKPLVSHMAQFVRVHASHLLDICERPTKGIYNLYCQKIVETYPEFADGGVRSKVLTWDILKSHITKAITNQRYYMKNKENILGKKKIVLKKRKCQKETNGTSGRPDLDSVSTGTIDEETRCNFEKRRSLIDQRKSSLTSEIVALVPEYLQFEVVLKDFFLLENVQDVTYSLFKERCNEILEQFRSFVGSVENSDYDILLEVNRQASTTKGTKYVPLFDKLQVGQKVTVTHLATSPHAILFYDGDTLRTMIVACGNGISFAVEVSNVVDALLNLLSVYFVFDVKYPAVYGLLYVVDCFCIQTIPPKKKTRVPACWTSFLKKFNMFMSTDKNSSKTEGPKEDAPHPSESSTDSQGFFTDD